MTIFLVGVLKSDKEASLVQLSFKRDGDGMADGLSSGKCSFRPFVKGTNECL